MAAPLTLSVLDPERRAALVAEYVRRYSRPSSFFLREAIPFLDLAIELASDVAHLRALAEFERAMLVLGEALASGAPLAVDDELRPDDLVSAHPLAAIVRFEAPPERVLAAASRGTAMPQRTDSAHWLLIAPVCRTWPAPAPHPRPRSSNRLRLRPGASQSLASLWRAGALQRRQ